MEKWMPVYDMDNEDGTHSSYQQMHILEDGRKLYIFVTENCKHGWDCEAMLQGEEFDFLYACKSLTSAKSWWKRNLQKVLCSYEEY